MIKNNETKSGRQLEWMANSESRLLFFSGSNSTNSINQQLVETLAKHIIGRDSGSLIDLKRYPMPLYSDTEEEKGIPKEANDLLKIIEDHDVLIIAVPEHNSGMPAFFKNIIDWMSRARNNYRVLNGKQIILLCASPGDGGKNAVLNTQIVLTSLGAHVIGVSTITNFYNNTATEGDNLLIKDVGFVSHLNDMLAQLKK